MYGSSAEKEAQQLGPRGVRASLPWQLVGYGEQEAKIHLWPMCNDDNTMKDDKDT